MKPEPTPEEKDDFKRKQVKDCERSMQNGANIDAQLVKEQELDEFRYCRTATMNTPVVTHTCAGVTKRE